MWAIEALKRCCEMPHAKYSIHCSFPDLNRKDNSSSTLDDDGQNGGHETSETTTTAAAVTEPSS